MKRLDKSILEVTRKNESAIIAKLLDKSTKCGLGTLSIEVIGLIKNDNLNTSGKTNGARELFDLIAKNVNATFL
jgi:hypothetical protein